MILNIMKIGYLNNLYVVHPPKDDVTISTKIFRNEENSSIYFSLGKNTNISEESYINPTFYICLGGDLKLTSKELNYSLNKNDLFYNKEDTLLGEETTNGTGYIEIQFGKENINMNSKIKAGEVLHLKDLLDYEEDSISNLDLAHNDKMKFVLMAFDKDQSLSAHRAPGEALIFVLEGEGIISYEGIDYKVKAGEQFHFEKNGLHAVKALTKFKMALLLTLD